MPCVCCSAIPQFFTTQIVGTSSALEHSEHFTFVARHDALTTEDYLFEIDEYRRDDDQLLLAHLRVFRWSPSVLKSLLKNWSLLRQCVKAPLFACAEVQDMKWQRFVKLLGFEPFHDILCVNGEQRRLYIHTTEGPTHGHVQHQRHHDL